MRRFVCVPPPARASLCCTFVPLLSVDMTRARPLNPSPLARADATIAAVAVDAGTTAGAVRVAQVCPGILSETAAMRVGVCPWPRDKRLRWLWCRSRHPRSFRCHPSQSET